MRGVTAHLIPGGLFRVSLWRLRSTRSRPVGTTRTGADSAILAGGLGESTAAAGAVAEPLWWTTSVWPGESLGDGWATHPKHKKGGLPTVARSRVQASGGWWT